MIEDIRKRKQQYKKEEQKLEENKPPKPEWIGGVKELGGVLESEKKNQDQGGGKVGYNPFYKPM